MGFVPVSLLPVDWHVDLSLRVGPTRYSHTRVKSTKNIVRMHLFFGLSHVTFSLPFISVIRTDPLGTFGCWDTDTYRGQNGGRFQRELVIYMQEECITFCLERESFSPTPLEWSTEDSLFYRTKVFSYLLL